MVEICESAGGRCVGFVDAGTGESDEAFGACGGELAADYELAVAVERVGG